MRRRSDFMMEDSMDESDCFDGTRGADRSRNATQVASVLISFGVVAALLGLYGIVYFADSSLPSPLLLSNEEAYPDAFIAERARNDLKNITDLGPRIAGGYVNEVLTVNLLTHKLNHIIETAHENQKFELNMQVVSGSHFLSRTPNGCIMAYSNLQNIIVKVHGSGNVSESLLVNAHFDSVPTSPGASDDAINCAVMLEILRILAKAPQRPLHDIIFLFNGAEEPGLQASHGFITKHKWAKDCKVVLNLEAAGIGGKIILFQTGPATPWLMNYYKKVPHPYGQAAGEEIFQSNVVPSDTDFRIFRDYGGLVGLDMAFFKSGYVYHTKYDDFDYIPPGSFQHVGDNALSLVRNLANASELPKPKENPGKVVFFDFLGVFMISYSQTAAHVINSIVILLSLAIFVSSISSFKLGSTGETVRYVTIILGTIIGGWIVAAVFVVLLALLVDKIGYSMSWYASPWLIFGLYVTPTVAFSFIVFPFLNNQNITHDVRSQIQSHCIRIIWTVILLIGTILNIRAMYALLVPVLFSTLGFLLIYLFTLRLRNKSTYHVTQWKQNCKKLIPINTWQIIYVVCLIIPTIFLMYSMLTTLSLFVPITGRIGSDKNADLMIGIISLFFTILITSPFVVLVTNMKNVRFVVIFLGIVFVVSFIAMFTPLGFPYTGNKSAPAPERYWIIHTHRIIHGENTTQTEQDAGYFLLNMDRNSPDQVVSYVKELSKARSMDDDCKNYLLCGVPIVHSKMVEILKYSTWIPAEKPTIPTQTELKFLKTRMTPTLLKYNISVSGPDRIALYLSPKNDVKILNISLIENVSKKQVTAVWNERDLYYIFHIYGKAAAPLNFTFDVEVLSDSVEITTEIAVCGVHVHNSTKTAEYLQFLGEFPDWTDVTAWLGTFESRWI